MSVTNESSRLRSWFQFASKSSTSRSDDERERETSEWQSGQQSGQQSAHQSGQQSGQHSGHQSGHTLLERVTSLRRSLGKSQQRKNKIRPLSAKGLTSAVEQQNIAKSKNSSTSRKPSPTASGGSVASANCDDDEIYGFTSANLESSNSSSTKRQLKSSLHAPNTSVYESETNKSGRVRNEDESHNSLSAAHAVHAKSGNACASASHDSPEWLKADREFSFYHQHQQQHQHNNIDHNDDRARHFYYQHQYYQDGDIRRSSTQHLSWTEPLSENDDIDRIYENMRGLSTTATLSSHQQRHHNQRNSASIANDSVCNNRKLTKDSGYESASTTVSTWGAANALSNNYFHSRSDSNASSVSTGGSLSPRTAGSSAKSAYHYYEPWASAKSTSNLPLQVQVSANNANFRRSSITGTANVYNENMATSVKSVLPAKSVPGNLDRETDDNIVHKRSHNRNNPTPSSVYSLLASKSGFDFSPILKLSRKSYINDNSFMAKYNEHTLLKGPDCVNSQMWKSRNKNSVQSCGQEDRYLISDDSPPPTPPIRDSSLASNRKFTLEPLNDAQNKSQSAKANEALNETNLSSTEVLYYKNNSNSYQANYSENRVNSIGYSKSLVNLRSKLEESDLKQFSQTYPLLPEADFTENQMQESWSCDQSVTSSCTGVTSLVTTSDYFTASSSAMTHSPSLSSLNTTATNSTSLYNYSRNSLTTNSSSQIARSAKVQQPKRQESASVLYYEKCKSPSNSVPPPPPPKLHFADYQENESSPKLSPVIGSKMIFLDPSKTQKTSDTEIKAIQKRAVYQFYLKQKQQEMQENCKTSPPEDNENTSEDAIEVPSRKVQLIVQNVYENSISPPSPPLPPPPPSTADVEMEDLPPLPLPPPPTPPPLPPHCEHESAISMITHSVSQKACASETALSLNVQQSSELKPIIPSKISSITRRTESVSLKSEIATQTTETLRRNGSKLEKGVTQSSEASNEVTETMYQNDVQASKLSANNKSIDDETYSPWAYSKLWPNDKCAKTTCEGDNGYISSSASPITAANTFIVNTGASFTSNDELLANKYELISRLARKLDILRSEEMALNQDIEANETLGQQIKAKLKKLGINNQESEKINIHCDETEKVTRLLLSISARLQHIEVELKDKSIEKRKSDDNDIAACFAKCELKSQSNVCHNSYQISDTPSTHSTSNISDEMRVLLDKRDKLLAQLEEALQLRASIDNRSSVIEEKILKKYFADNSEDVIEFLEFVKLKSKLIVDIREIKDKIQMGEKHLQALKAF